jgi:hypothetical protein
MTGVAHWPERGSPETRTAPQSFRENQKHARDPVRLARRTIASIHAAEREMQDDSLAAERRQALAAGDAGLRSLHANKVAAVVSKFADRRAALVHMTDAGARVAASQQIALEEANELARLAIEHAAERRRMRASVMASLGGKQRAARRKLRQSQRRQRAGLAVQLHALHPQVSRYRHGSRVAISRTSLLLPGRA